MALIKLILVFLLSQVCIIVFFSVTTSSYALPYPAGAGRGTLDCGHFIEKTTEIDEDGKLSGLSYIHRLEYVQWAYGFLTAFNIRYYEKNDTFKDLTPVSGKGVGYEDMYNKLVSSCHYLDSQLIIEDEKNFGMAVYSIFSNLPEESI